MPELIAQSSVLHPACLHAREVNYVNELISELKDFLQVTAGKVEK